MPVSMTVSIYKASNGYLICIVIQLYIATAILCLHYDFNTLPYHSAKSKSHVTPHTFRKVNLVLNDKLSSCRVSNRAWSESIGFWYSRISKLDSNSWTELGSNWKHTELAFSKIHFLPYCFQFDPSSVQLLKSNFVLQHMIALQPVRKILLSDLCISF